jgi:hypothetical protein
MTEAKQKQRNWTKIGMIAGGVVLLIAVVIAVLNTYTDLFEDSFKPKPEPKQVASNLKYGEPDNVNDDTPAKEFTDEVIAAYSEFEKVSAQMLLGSECSAQIHINGGTDAKWRVNKALEPRRSRTFANGRPNTPRASVAWSVWSSMGTWSCLPRGRATKPKSTI